MCARALFHLKAHLFPIPQSVMAHRWLEFGHHKSIYTKEIGQHYKSQGNWLSFSAYSWLYKVEKMMPQPHPLHSDWIGMALALDCSVLF